MWALHPSQDALAHHHPRQHDRGLAGSALSPWAGYDRGLGAQHAGCGIGQPTPTATHRFQASPENLNLRDLPFPFKTLTPLDSRPAWSSFMPWSNSAAAAAAALMGHPWQAAGRVPTPGPVPCSIAGCCTATPGQWAWPSAALQACPPQSGSVIRAVPLTTYDPAVSVTGTAPLPDGTPWCSPGPLWPQGPWEPTELPCGRSTAKPPWLVTRQHMLQGPSLWLFKFPFHEQMKHFILYDFPTMAVIPFHLSGTRDDGGKTRALGYWQLVLSTQEDTFTFT